MDLWCKFTRTPGGRLEAAGVWPGDIPMDTRGGRWAFYEALVKLGPCTKDFSRDSRMTGNGKRIWLQPANTGNSALLNSCPKADIAAGA